MILCQSAIVPLVPLLIYLVHAMSSSSGDYGNVGVAAGGSDPGLDPGRPAISEESDDVRLSVGHVPNRRVRRRMRGPAELQSSGTLWTLAVSEGADMSCRIFGVVKLRWELREPTTGHRNDCGVCVYSSQLISLLENSFALPPGIDTACPLTCANALNSVNSEFLCSGGTVAARLTHEGARSVHLLLCSVAETDMLRQAADGVGESEFRSVAIHKRTAPRGIIAGSPGPALLRSWRRAQDDGAGVDVVEPREEDPLTFLPVGAVAQSDIGSRPRLMFGGKREVDPIRLVHAASICLHLRSTKLFEEAIDDSYDYIFLDHDGDTPPPRRRKDQGPSHRQLQTALARIDVVAMLLTRRKFRRWRKLGCVRSINVYSDASPVTGEELQGMVVDINFRDNSMERLTLPGSTLAYGHTDTLSKSVALIWAIWLVAGPELDDLRWFCGNITSLTTDFGVEIHLMECPDILEAFVIWARGNTPLHELRGRPWVKSDARAFPRALRVGGWSHMMGNIMKAIAAKFDAWPVYLESLRALCKFFRNESYRSHIRRRLHGLPAELKRALKSFTAGFAKWRYETVPEVLTQLVAYRLICAELSPELFAHAQDLDLIRKVIRACRDLGFWKWAAVSNMEVFQPLETLRRWGMLCDCPGHQAERARVGRGKHIECNRTISNPRFSFDCRTLCWLYDIV